MTVMYDLQKENKMEYSKVAKKDLHKWQDKIRDISDYHIQLGQQPSSPMSHVSIRRKEWKIM